MIKNFYFRIILIIGLTTVCCSFFGQTLLFLINISKNYYQYLILLTPLVLLFTKYSNKIIKTHGVGMKYFVEAANKDNDKVSWFFPIVLTINTQLAPIANNGVTSPPLKPIAVHIAVNINFKIKSYTLILL